MSSGDGEHTLRARADSGPSQLRKFRANRRKIRNSMFAVLAYGSWPSPSQRPMIHQSSLADQVFFHGERGGQVYI